MFRRMSAAAFVLTLATPAFADDAIATAVSRLVGQCPRMVDATALLVALQRSHRIGKPISPRANGESCWRVRPDITIEKMFFQYICATNTALAPLVPDLYPVVPGMQPPNGVRILTTSPLSEVQSWAGYKAGLDFDGAQKRIGPPNGNYSFPEGKRLTQIECVEGF